MLNKMTTKISAFLFSFLVHIIIIITLSTFFRVTKIKTSESSDSYNVEIFFDTQRQGVSFDFLSADNQRLSEWNETIIEEKTPEILDTHLKFDYSEEEFFRDYKPKFYEMPEDTYSKVSRKISLPKKTFTDSSDEDAKVPEQRQQPDIESTQKKDDHFVKQNSKSDSIKSEWTPASVESKFISEYPKIALKNGWEGTVELLVEVLQDGSIKSIVILKSSGYDVLDKSSVECVKRWKFRPARVGTKAVDSKIIIPIRYKID